MASYFTQYQRLGIYPRNRTHARIIPALTEISRACGVPDVAMSTYQASGVGLHRTGEACDFQAGNAEKYGSKYAEARSVHNAIAKYVLANWKRLKVRYMAWDGKEWGGSWGGPERERKQATNYGGSDPWHKHHVHVDFKPGAISQARPGIAIGAGLSSTPKPSLTSKYYYPNTHKLTGTQTPATVTALQRFLSDRGYYKRAIDGDAGTYTWLAFQEFLRALGYFGPKPSGKRDMTTARAVQQWLTNAGHYKAAITAHPAWDKNTWKALQTYLRYAHKGTKVYNKPSVPKPAPTPKPTTPKPAPKPTPSTPSTPTQKDPFMALNDKEQKSLLTDNRKIKTAIERNERRSEEMLEYLSIIASAVTDSESKGTLRHRVEQTNAAVGRAEKARKEQVAAEKESTDD